MPPLIVRLTAHPIGVQTGDWCDRCALPSVVTVTAACEIDHKPWQVITCSLCTECMEEP